MTSSALCSCYAATLSTVLVRSDSSVVINAVLLDVSRSLVKRIDSLWKAWKQAKYIEAVSNNASVDPATLRLLQRKCNPSPPVRGRRNPRSYTGSDVVMSPGSTPLGKRPSRTQSGFGANSNGLKQGEKAEECVTQVLALGQLPPPSSDVVLYTEVCMLTLTTLILLWGVQL